MSSGCVTGITWREMDGGKSVGILNLGCGSCLSRRTSASVPAMDLIMLLTLGSKFRRRTSPRIIAFADQRTIRDLVQIMLEESRQQGVFKRDFRNGAKVGEGMGAVLTKLDVGLIITNTGNRGGYRLKCQS
jgi:hypothetical protein